MADMMRDFGNLKKEYQDLLAKKTESALATSLERQQQGAQFRVIDPPSLPDKPNFPDRFKFSLAAIGAGLALAILCGFGVEFLDDRIRGEQALHGSDQSAHPGRDSSPVDGQGAEPRPLGAAGWLWRPPSCASSCFRPV